MITVYIPNNFIPERTYAVKTLLHHYCGIEVDIHLRPKQIHYELTWEGKSIVIKDQFFGHTIVGQTYLAADRIPSRAVEAKSPDFDECVILFGDDKIEISDGWIISDVDLFAGAYFMLTRWEESLGLHEDLHGRFPAAQALIVKSGFILRPVVDEYAALLKKWLRQLGYEVPESKTSFKVIPTCDVDMPYYWLRGPQWKVVMAEWMKNKTTAAVKKARKTIKLVTAGSVEDPYDQFDYMMSLAEARGLRFQFNMLVGGISKFEGFYSIKDQRIQELLKSFVERGHRIGLHPSYNSFLDQRLIDEEKKLLSKYCSQPVQASRQHYLRFSIPTTWQYLRNAGIKEDSSMGYAAEPGFRCGTSHPFPVFDIHSRETLPMLERPLLIMDVTFRYYLNLSPEASMALCDQIIRQVRKHQGELIFLWHNSNLSDVEDWSAWRKVFEYLMSISPD